MFWIGLWLQKQECTNPAKKQRKPVMTVTLRYENLVFFIPSINTQPEVLLNKLHTRIYPEMQKNITINSTVRQISMLALSLNANKKGQDNCLKAMKVNNCTLAYIKPESIMVLEELSFRQNLRKENLFRGVRLRNLNMRQIITTMGKFQTTNS